MYGYRCEADHLLAQWRYRLSHHSHFYLPMMRRLVRSIRLVARIASISDNPSSLVVVGSDLPDRWTAQSNCDYPWQDALLVAFHDTRHLRAFHWC